MNIIVKANIKKINTTHQLATAILSNGDYIELFTFYEDEIIINAFELENKTVEQARELKRTRQMAWEKNFTPIPSYTGNTY